MERKIRKVVVWIMAVVIGVAASWGIEAKAAISTSMILHIGDTAVVSSGKCWKESGTGWKYDETDSILTLANADIDTIICNSGDLNIELNGTNKIGKITFNGSSKRLKIFGSGSLTFTGTNAITAKSVEINNTRVTANSIANTSGSITITGSQVTVTNSISSSATITNSCIRQGNQITVYGNVTLKEKLTVGSSDTITYQSGATISNSNLLEIKDGATIKYDKIQFKATSGTGWTYSDNILTLTNTTLSDVKCTSGDLNIQLTGTNTINGLTVNSSSSNLNITGSGLLNLTGTNTINVSSMKIDGMTVKANSIKNNGGTSTITNSCIVESNLVTVYGEVTLQEKLTVGSGKTINFQEGSITNLDYLTVDENAIIQVNGEIHKHNTDASYQWKDENTHTKTIVCENCPINYGVQEDENHDFDIRKEHCKNCGWFPAVLTTDKYDINGDGTKDEVYEISNAGQLYWFAALVNGELSGVTRDTSANAVLTSNIVVNENVLDANGNLSSDSNNFVNWTPIGAGDSHNQSIYNGIFDGKGYTISGLYYNDSNATYIGFIGGTNSEFVVRDLSLVDVYFAGNQIIATLVTTNNGRIENCSVSGTVKAVGEISGICYRNNGTITDCKNNDAMKLEATDIVSGICMENNQGTITNCHIDNNVILKAKQGIGGICYTNYEYGKITKCYSSASIQYTGNYEISNICNRNQGTIENCYGVGGIVGIWENEYHAKIKNCYSRGSEMGVIFGCLEDDIENSYYDSEDYDSHSERYKTKAQFASGEVAYLLQENQEEKVWGQDIGTDDYPVLGGKKVYQSKKYMACNTEYVREYVYSNDEREDIIVDEHLDTDSDGKCDGCGKLLDDMSAILIGYTLSLEGNIGVNFYMELSDAIAKDQNAYMQFTVDNGTPIKVPISQARENTTLKEGTTYYVFQCKVNASEMTKTITAQMFDGTSKCGKAYSYTVRDYALYLITHKDSFPEGSSSFAVSLLNYGASAQKYFGVKVDDLANSPFANIDKDVAYIYELHKEYDGMDINEYKGNAVTNEILGKFVGTSLVLKSETTLNIFYEPNEGVDVKNLTFKIDGKEVTPIQRGKYYVIPLVGITANDLATKYSFTVTDGENTLTGEYCALAYCCSIINAESGTYDEDLVTLTKALVNYYLDAKSLFENMQ